MDRDSGRLLRAATLVQDDLRRTAGETWTCVIDADFVLKVTDGARSESVDVSRRIDDPDWFLREDMTQEQQEAALDDEAVEAVADKVLDVLGDLGVPWPTCAEHHVALSSCSGLWICNGPPPHDVAKIGTLGL